MKIEALETIKSDGYVLVEGDSINVPDSVGSAWCAYGWARDVAGSIPTGMRRVLDARLDVASITQNAGIGEV